MIASWYPCEHSPLRGVFIQEQARELSKHTDIAVVHVDYIAEHRYVAIDREDGFPVVRVGSPLSATAGTNPIARIHDLYSRSLGFTAAARRGVHALRESGWGKPDTIHAQVLYPAGFIARSLSKELRVPYVVTEHSSEFMPGNERFLRRNRSIRWLMRRAARDASRVMPVSTCLQKRMGECGVDADYHIVPNMVRDDVMPAAPEEVDFQQVAHVSLLNDRAKNVSGLLRVCAELRDEGLPPFRLRIVGDGADRESLESLARDLGLVPDMVSFEGRLSRQNTLDLIRKSAFLVTPSHFETFSIVTAEALMCGRPVVATRCGGPEDFVTPKVGILVPVGDHGALKAAVREMRAKASDYDSVAIAEYARARFAPAAVAERILGVYQTALRK